MNLDNANLKQASPPFDAIDSYGELLNVHRELKGREDMVYLEKVLQQFGVVISINNLGMFQKPGVNYINKDVEDAKKKIKVMQIRIEEVMLNFLTSHKSLFEGIQSTITNYEILTKPANGVGHYYPKDSLEKYAQIMTGERLLSDFTSLYLEAKKVVEMLIGYLVGNQVSNLDVAQRENLLVSLRDYQAKLNAVPYKKFDALRNIVYNLHSLAPIERHFNYKRNYGSFM